MSVIQRESIPALAAGATVDNIFSGSAFEFARQNSLLNMAIVGSATGLVATIQVGSRVVLEESPLALLGTMPKLQDDFYYSEGVLANERIICRVRNTSAGALTYRCVAQLQPV
jgi:hypothetical protein